MSPPLRTADDRAALREAVASGVVDILVTDHAPHAAHEKDETLDLAPCGLTGLDLALSLTWELVREGVLAEVDVHRLWSHRPAEIFGLPWNGFAPGDPADFFLFDADATWQVTPEALRSRGKNTPFLGRELHGRVRHHWLGGKALF